LVELLSAAVVSWRFRFAFDEARAARIAGALLYVLAGLVVLASVLNVVRYREAQQRADLAVQVCASKAHLR
jgi:hypothetical protein